MRSKFVSCVLLFALVIFLLAIFSAGCGGSRSSLVNNDTTSQDIDIEQEDPDNNNMTNTPVYPMKALTGTWTGRGGSGTYTDTDGSEGSVSFDYIRLDISDVEIDYPVDSIGICQLSYDVKISFDNEDEVSWSWHGTAGVHLRVTNTWVITIEHPDFKKLMLTINLTSDNTAECTALAVNAMGSGNIDLTLTKN